MRTPVRSQVDLPPSAGERNPAALLTADKVRTLRADHAAGAQLTSLARAFGISERAARHVVQRTTWRHVE